MTSPIRILHVEDDPIDRDLVRNALEKEQGGFIVTHTDSRRTFEELLSRETFDLVLSDFNILGFDGFQVMDAVRARNPAIPVIFVTGTGSEEIAVEAMKRGAADYVLKSPKHLKRLPLTIHAALERKQAVEERDRLFSQSLDLFCVVGFDGCLRQANPRWEATLGWTPDELSSTPFIDLVHPDDREATFRAWAALLRDGEIRHFVNRYRCKDGSYRWLSWNGHAMAGEQRVFAVARDVTELKRAEDTIRESEHHYQTLAEVSPVGIFRTDPTGATTYVNPRWCEISGMAAQEAMGNGWLEIVHPEDRHLVSGGWNEKVQTGSESTCEYRFLKPDGKTVWVYGQATPEYNAEKQLIGYVGTITDITDRKEAEERTSAHIRRLTALHNVELAVAGNLDLEATLEILLHQALSSLQIDAAQILMYDPATNRLEFRASLGFRTAAFRKTSLPPGEGLAGRVMVQRQIVHLPDLPTEPGSLSRAPLLSREGFLEYYGIPLVAKAEIVGVLELFHRTSTERDEEWMEILEMLAQEASIAIDNARLFADLQHSNAELSEAYDSTLEGWALAIDLRDRETHGHSVRVADLTVMLARMLGIGDAELVHIRRGAILHDVGKLAVPDSVLLKPGPLDDAEWEIMRKHPVFAYEMLSSIPFLRSALDIPHYHHEKWDGTGYPEKLAGDSIPLPARIFAIIDVWDALGSVRPYRPPWDQERILAHIRSLSGTHFDPEVVNVFLKAGFTREMGGRRH